MIGRNPLEDIYRTFDTIKPDEYGCHQWPKAVVGYYWRVKVQGKAYPVHRLALERKLGRPIKPGFKALHTCDCKSCVNPNHLYEGTQGDNVRDREERNLEYVEARREQFRKYVQSPEAKARVKNWWANNPERRELARELARKMVIAREAKKKQEAEYHRKRVEEHTR
jgi:hypothetical protein